jgi:hypothetical protein
MQQLPIWIVDQHIGSAILILERCKQLIAEQKSGSNIYRLYSVNWDNTSGEIIERLN